MTTTKKWRGGGKELSLANSKTLEFFNVRFPTCSHSYVYFDIAMDMKSLWCPFLWELLGAWGVLVMSFYWKSMKLRFLPLNIYLNWQTGQTLRFYMNDSHISTKTHSVGGGKKRDFCVHYTFFALIRNSFISPSSSSSISMLLHNTAKKKQRRSGSRQGKY